MTKRYTASDFANAKFAEHPDGRTARRIESERGTVFAWSVERAGGEEDYCGDEYLAAHCWVPVPTKPTITENEYERVLAGVNEDYATGYSDALNTFGIEVIPDPMPTNAEKLTKVIREIGYDIRHNGNRSGPVALALDLDARGVKAPGGDE